VNLISKSSLHKYSELHLAKLHAFPIMTPSIHASYVSVKRQRSLSKKYCANGQSLFIVGTFKRFKRSVNKSKR
jgi:hypothetical protein